MSPILALLICITTATVIGVIALMIIVYRYRRDKAMKSNSPSMTYLLMVGAIIMCAEFPVTSFPCNRVTCMIRPWVRHIGFFTFYGALLFKTWRVSVVICAFKSTTFRTKDSELLKMAAVAVITCTLFLALWTVVDPIVLRTRLDVRPTCRLQWWEVVAVTAEWAFLLWGAVVSYHARRAPVLYNECPQLGFVIWNESMWCLFYLFARLILERHPDTDLLLYLHFLRVECTVTCNVLLLFVPKLLHLFRKAPILNATLTDVHGVRQIHRVSVETGRGGEVQCVNCVPCGPLTLSEDETEGTQEELDQSVEESWCYLREDEYSKAEVDALIEMVSQLKTEKEAHKLETRRLWRVLRDYGFGEGCLASSAVSPEEEDIVLRASIVDRELRSGHGRYQGTVQPMEMPSCTSGVNEDMATDTFEGSSTPSPERCRRASTVSSYLSSSTSSSAIDLSSSDDLLGCSECDNLIGAGVKLPLLGGFTGLRVTDIDGERLDNVVAMFDGYFTDNNGNRYECHQQADVATVYDSIDLPDVATQYSGCRGPLRYARRVSKQKRARMCNKVNFVMHI